MASASESPTRKCVHKGCGKTYTDPTEECIYHPGPPEFHEGQKGWMCCKPRVLTFDEFLDIKGCTRGVHSEVDDTPKPAEKKIEDEHTIPSSTTSANGPSVPTTKPIAVSEKTVQSSLAAAMAAQPLPSSRSTTPSAPVLEEDSDEEGIEDKLEEGMSCKRRSCGKSYSKNIPRDQEKCVYHPGVPLFHEGSKGWTCCKRRVLEFEEFLKIEGCKERSGHCYIGKKKGDENKRRVEGGKMVGGEEILEDKDVRSDFYQTAGQVIVSFYLKKIVKDEARVGFETGGGDGGGGIVKLDLKTSDGKRYKSDVEVWGEIEPSSCKHRVLGTKLEVTLVKGGEAVVGWPVLRRGDRDTGERIQVGRAGRA